PFIGVATMPATLTLTEADVGRLAPDDSSLKSARDLIRKKSFLQPAVSADGTWLLAQCKGSGSQPYEVSVDLADPAAPVGRCNCPSRKLPCKHALGLMLAYVAAPASFAEREPPEELLAQSEKKVQGEQQKTE